jgi:hypothetical protein
MRWQVTPLLFSFGVHRRAVPWRLFVVEPFLRQSGSTELFFSPEVITVGSEPLGTWLWRTGIRSYFPIIERGDYLSVSVGASHFVFAGRGGAALEAGAYLLFGIVGTQVTWSPSDSPAQTIVTLRLRYF